MQLQSIQQFLDTEFDGFQVVSTRFGSAPTSSSTAHR